MDLHTLLAELEAYRDSLRPGTLGRADVEDAIAGVVEEIARAASAVIPIDASRPVIRCSGCALVQYKTSNNCRRCRASLLQRHIPLHITVAQGLKAWRIARRLTQAQLAEKTALPRTYISRIEHGAIVPGLDLLLRFSQVLGVPLAACLYEHLWACARLTPDQRGQVLALVRSFVGAGKGAAA